MAGALAVAKLTKSSLIWQRLEQILLKVTVPLVLALSVDGKLVFLKCDSIENFCLDLWFENSFNSIYILYAHLIFLNLIL